MFMFCFVLEIGAGELICAFSFPESRKICSRSHKMNGIQKINEET